MKVDAIIIEDEKLTADRLEKQINEQTDLQVVQKLFSVKSGIEWLQRNPLPEVIFLDIQLGDGTGFDVLEEIDAWPSIIFTTAFDQYVLEAFKYNSVDYLLKPVKPEELKKAVEKLQNIHRHTGLSAVVDQLNSQLFKKYKRKFLVKTGTKYKSITVEETSCFYSKDSCTYLRSESGESLILDQTLDQLVPLLDPKSFFRINRHIIVNADKIAGINSYFNGRLLLETEPVFEEEMIVSREKVKAFKQWLDE